MSTRPATPSGAAPRVKSAATACMAATVAFAAIGVFDLVARPPFTDNHLHTASDYVFNLLGIPFVLTALAVVATLHQVQAGRDGRLGRAGSLITGAALVAFLPALVASLLTGDERALSPLYPLAALASFVGMILFATGMLRARVLPRWAGPALAAGWLIGGPIAPARGLFLLEAAVCALLAETLVRRGAPAAAAAREDAPVGTRPVPHGH